MEFYPSAPCQSVPLANPAIFLETFFPNPTCLEANSSKAASTTNGAHKFEPKFDEKELLPQPSPGPLPRPQASHGPVRYSARKTTLRVIDNDFPPGLSCLSFGHKNRKDGNKDGRLFPASAC